MDDPRQRAATMLRGYLTTQLVYVAARLDLMPRLSRSAASAEELAQETGARASGMERLLRALAAHGLVRAEEDGRYTAQSTGAALCDPDFRAWAILTGEVFYPARAGLLDAVREDASPFEAQLGAPFFDHLSAHPELAEAFARGMAAQSAQVAESLAKVLDLTGVRTVADLGGGQGQYLRALLAARPYVEGILVDRPEVLDLARGALAIAGLAGRVQCVPADLHRDVVPTADVYLLSRVLHDWPDDVCIGLLGRVRASIGRGAEARVVVVESLIPERITGPTPVVESDLAMLCLLGGRERRLDEFDRLFSAADLHRAEVLPLVDGNVALVARAIV